MGHTYVLVDADGADFLFEADDWGSAELEALERGLMVQEMIE